MNPRTAPKTPETNLVDAEWMQTDRGLRLGRARSDAGDSPRLSGARPRLGSASETEDHESAERRTRRDP
jgi:hypothetical protein